MSTILEKIDNFIFDILGLIVPGLVILLLVLLPGVVVDELGMFYMKTDIAFVGIYYETTREFFMRNKSNIENTIFLTCLIICSYIVGHLVKVLSMIFYGIGKSIFDNGLLRKYSLREKKLRQFVKYCIRKNSLECLLNICSWIYNEIYKLFRNHVLYAILKFSSDNYFSNNKSLEKECREMLNKKFGMNVPKGWHNLYKVYRSLSDQNKIKSLTTNYLAKYNLYRSLSFIFFANFLFLSAWMYIIFPTDPTIKTHRFIFATYVLNGLLWYTFHVKYKRYWTLTGHEALFSLYSFLKRMKSEEQSETDERILNE